MEPETNTLINLDRYPIHIDGAARDALIAQIHEQLAQDGCVVLKQFLTPSAVGLVTKEADSVAQYAPNIRRSGENFEAVKKVLDGSSDQTVSLALEPGDLQLFKGRYSLHRVSPLSGNVKRYVAIFSYVEEPNMVGAPERTKQLYGRVLPIHLERAGHRADSYID